MKNLVDCHFCGGTGVVESLNNRILCEECLGFGYCEIDPDDYKADDYTKGAYA